MLETLSKVKNFLVSKKKYVAIVAASLVAFNEYLNGTLDLAGMVKAVFVALGAA